MPRFETAYASEGYRAHCEDRVGVVHDEDRSLIVVADGAGGVGQGAEAAETVIREVIAMHRQVKTAEQWEAALLQIDGGLGTGQSTAVVVDLRADVILGASVGDSQAWIVREGEILVLNAGQQPKPLLGTGEARPTRFSHGPLDGTLIVATDGFCDYVKRDHLFRIVAQADWFELPRRCIDLVRLPSGALWDDVGIVVCRMDRPRRTRKRYVI